MYSKFVKTVVKSPEEIYPTCLERSGMGKFSIPPTSKKVGWGKFLSHLPRWDRILADTSQWQRLPAEFDKDQAKAYSFTEPDHSTNRISDRSSGLGPVNGRPP